MTADAELVLSFYEGWREYQNVMTKAISPLDAAQLALRASSNLRSVGEIAAHVVAVRARWFYLQFGECEDQCKAFGGWDQEGAQARSAQELVDGLEATWKGMHDAIARWTAEDWKMTWPGEDETEPDVITRPWVIWHLIEHDLHHGGEISHTLRAHGVQGLEI
jgi:uncharacterized damage-inducible protein DinB